MDIDVLMRETGRRWRDSQPPAPAYDLEALLPGGGRRRGRTRLTVLVAAATAAAAVAAVFLFHQGLAPAQAPVRPAAPVTTPSSITPAQLVGTWYSSVSATEARTTFRALVGDWVLNLHQDGSARIALSNGTNKGDGRWRLNGPTLTLDLPFPGCPTAGGGYQPTISTLHPGLLELVPVDAEESCHARSLVVGGHWFSSPDSPS